MRNKEIAELREQVSQLREQVENLRGALTIIKNYGWDKVVLFPVDIIDIANNALEGSKEPK